MLEKLLKFSRHNKMALLMLLDAALLPLALYSAVLLRLGGSWDPKLDPYLWIFAVPPLKTNCTPPLSVVLVAVPPPSTCDRRGIRH